MTHTKSSNSSTLVDYGWGYDEGSRITTFTNSAHSAENAAFSYDTTNQLTGADRSGDTNDESWGWDANGNRTDGSYDVDANNKMSTDGVYNYTYDEEGNRTLRVKISDGQRTEYLWDWRNRLASVVLKDAGGTVLGHVDYAYDAFNQRIGKFFDANNDGTYEKTERFFHDQGNIALIHTDADGEGANAGFITNRFFYTRPRWMR